ncbi:polyphosphate kinase 2 [Alkalicaulis satelles]|uniref:ADP/GDP-polyphosphate phosphotransferase n=1 Tax=Alkalicaulis satelles TaxID=2609175 RepID=A0A5M6ZF77_9PROT|nr:polyphosphate kinase 2 [Alkalicaulis satelles]KAA5803396.1 polyphosphate kinase 2 [Alkalicaulis satelles]
MDKKTYKRELTRLQIGLVALQRHLIATGARLLVILEGRDAAGKDGAIKRIVEHQSPRETRVVALGVPTERDRTSWYFQRWAAHLPAGGEMVLFNRSWYNRAGVEKVMGFCKPAQHEAFMRDVGPFEHILTDDGLTILKFYLDISRAEQARRLEARRTDPLKTWKTSPIDAVALEKFDAYSKARNAMLAATGDAVPWRVVKADDKRTARLAIIRDILQTVPCPKLPERYGAPDPSVLRVWSPGDRPQDHLHH